VKILAVRVLLTARVYAMEMLLKMSVSCVMAMVSLRVHAFAMEIV
jgi:hypothetical protein